MAFGRNKTNYRCNLALAKRLWPGQLNREQSHSLRSFSENYGLSVAAGDLQFLNGQWYVTHAGLLHLASRRKCSAISTFLQERVSDPATNRWVFRAVVYKRSKSKGFVGYGDADPSTVSALMNGAEMRIAETRAVNRALRKAYAIAICSIEELRAISIATKQHTTNSSSSNGPGSRSPSGSGNHQPRLRDQLCLLIRQFNLDANLVKTYAADFCGTEVLSEASRESVQSFISHLSTEAKENRDALICKLNSYAQPVEARS